MKTFKVLAFDIEYDTDGVSVDWLRNEGANLPEELWLEVDAEALEDCANGVADAISELTGWCVNTFNYKAFSK